MTAEDWLIVVATAAVALLAPIAVRRFLRARSAYDLPNARSSHSDPTLRGGGLATLFGWTVGGTVALSLEGGLDRSLLAAVLVAATAIALVGLVEDLRGLRAVIRFAAQIVIGLALMTVLCLLTTTSWCWVPIGAVGFAAYVNTANFMDGINGISSLHGGLVGTAYGLAGLLVGLPWLTVIGATIAVAFLAFLPWNLSRPGLFLGDVGSYLLGGAVCATTIAGLTLGASALVMLAPLTIYLADTVFTAAVRVNHGEFLFDAHRTHSYQRLVSAGWPHLASAGLVTLASAACAALGLLSASGRIDARVAVLVIVAIAAGYLALPTLLGQSFPPRVNLPLVAVPAQGLNPSRPGFLPRRIIVLGASGFVGSGVTRELENAGLRVERVPAPRLQLDPAIAVGATVVERARSCEATRALAAQFAGSDVVINAAGLATPDAPASPQLYGADALLPVVTALAAAQAGVARVIHLSSAAVQGSRPELDNSTAVDPFSPYSRAKALGEAGIFALRGSWGRDHPGAPDVIVVRATSVQGEGRGTTSALQRIAASPLATVAAPGTQPTVVSSLDGLSKQVRSLVLAAGPTPPLVLQPWEGLSAAGALERAGGRPPRVLPRWLCRTALTVAKIVTGVIPDYGGLVRRVELMWMGQRQTAAEIGPATLPGSRA